MVEVSNLDDLERDTLIYFYDRWRWLQKSYANYYAFSNGFENVVYLNKLGIDIFLIQTDLCCSFCVLYRSMFQDFYLQAKRKVRIEPVAYYGEAYNEDEYKRAHDMLVKIVNNSYAHQDIESYSTLELPSRFLYPPIL